MFDPYRVWYISNHLVKCKWLENVGEENSPVGIFDHFRLGVVQEVDQVVQKFKCLQSFNLLADTFLLAALIQKFL